MRLLSLQLRDFRNLASVDLIPSPRATILVGENAQGKTNLLEAVFFLATLKPLRPARLADLVKFGAACAHVAADLQGPGGARRAGVEIRAGARTVYLDGKQQDRLDGYFDGLAAVCFSPDDLLLVKSGPEARRRFLDRAAFNRWPAVLGEAREFVRALRARNASLRGAPHDVEASFREPLLRAAARLRRRRLDLVAELAPRLAAAFAEISGGGAPDASLTYRSASGLPADTDEASLASHLAEVFARRLERDRERGYTSAGPHMDDLSLSIGGRDARTYASQGQQRALVLALKMAEIENLRFALGRPPLLLLDDVSSELDPVKNGHLLRYLAQLPAQALLTSTDRRLLEPAAGPETSFFQVQNGGVLRLVS